jgi:very-short-patch-repair endonuclease
MRNRLKPESLERARHLRREATGPEMKLWWKLRALKPLGFHFRRQVPFRGYILDFAEHYAGLVIELDGSQHGSTDQRSRDEKRDALLAGEGYRVLRFWNGEVEENLGGVVEAIIHEARMRVPAPHPPAPHPDAPALTRSLVRPPHEGEVKKRPSVLPRSGKAMPVFRKP